jgi:hypothetical protein
MLFAEQFSSCKIRGFHGGDYEECRLLGYKNPVPTPRRHYVFATEPSRLMLCKICCFHGGEYDECRLLGYKNPVCTSQKTHYFSATEPSRLMLNARPLIDLKNGVLSDVTPCGSYKSHTA